MLSWGVVEELSAVVLSMRTEAVEEASEVEIASVVATLEFDFVMSSSSWVVDSINVELADGDDVVDDVDSGSEVPSGGTVIVDELLGASGSMSVVVASENLLVLSSDTVVVSSGMDVSPDPVVSNGNVVLAEIVVSSGDVSSGCAVVELAVALGDFDVDSF